MTGVRILDEMKHDAFGVVERVALVRADRSEATLVRRALTGPSSLRPLARALARREERVLAAIASAGVSGVAPVVELSADELALLCAAPTLRGDTPRPGDVFLRGFAPGAPLHRADELPRDFFELLESSIRGLHAAGVCHNDLHKEQNVVVSPSGRPVLIDFQLASLHPRRRGRRFRARCRDDLRHAQKLRRRYTKDGRGPAELVVPERERMRRRGLALAWRRTGKPVYHFVTRRVLRTRDGEDRRPSAGPWPRWTEPVGPARPSGVRDRPAG